MRAKLVLTGVVALLLFVPAANADTFRWFPATGKERGVMLVLPGGGWYGGFGDRVHTGELESVTGLAPGFHRRWNRQGWTVLSVAYRGGRESMIDVRRGFSLARSKGKPVCAHGVSAGGHLALMLAIQRPRLDCVIANGAPTNLVAGRWNLNPAPNDEGMRSAVDRFFGSDREILERWSPVHRAGEIRATVLVATSRCDPVVPVFHTRGFRSMRSRAMVLGSGTDPFVHCGVSRIAARRYGRAVRRLLRSVKAKNRGVAARGRRGDRHTGCS